MYRRRRSSQGRGGNYIGLIIAAVFVLFSVIRYCSTATENEFTGHTQHVGITKDQEVAIGLQSAPQMINQYGGLFPNEEAQDFVRQVGQRIVKANRLDQSGYEFSFNLLADPNTVNAFALPGGPVFITYALFARLSNEDELAGVIGHEIGHVVARHGGERIAKDQLIQGVTGAAVIASGDYSTAQAAQMIGNLINMSYGRDQELQSDELGVKFMIEAQYDPYQMIKVMDILEQASGGKRQSEFMSTHPSPENRREKIKEAIDKYSKN